MALSPKFSTGMRDAILNGSGIDTMFDGGFLDIYSGTKPTNADTAEAGTKLVGIALPTPAFTLGSGNSFMIKAGTWQDASADAGDPTTATWFRIYDSAHTLGASTTAIRMDGTVGKSNADLIFESVSVTAGDTVNVDAFTFQING